MRTLEVLKMENVKQYYGTDIEIVEDFKTSVCDHNEKLPSSVVQAMASVHPEVNSKYYGCGPVFPEAVEGCRVVDLGSGAGRDCFLLSKLVGSTGFVTGVDMTPELLEVARKHIDYHMEKFGYSSSNISFLEGYIEDLQNCGIGSESTDIIVSNCVICLCKDKEKVFRSAYNVLKNGGELYFSDMYTDKPVTWPAHLKDDKILWGEGITGALYWKDLMNIATSVGFSPPVLVDVANISIDDPGVKKTIGDLKLCSATYRLFKVASKNTMCNAYEVLYKGTIPDCPTQFNLAYNTTLSSCCPVLLPASIAQLLMDTRLAPHFSLTPLSGGSSAEQTVPACAELSESVNINPFDMLATKKTHAN